MHLGFRLKDEIDKIQTGKYVSPYKIEYSDKYKGKASNEFVAANSNFVFLWDSNKNTMNVIPKSEVVSYHAK